MVSEFVRQRLQLAALADNYIDVPVNDNSLSHAEVIERRDVLKGRVSYSPETKRLIKTIATRQAIGDDVPVAANDNQPKSTLQPKVRKSTGKSVRGSFAEMLPMVWALRNTPDHMPEPISSNWSVDASATIAEPDVDETGEKLPGLATDMLLEITPSIAGIRRQIDLGPAVRGAINLKPISWKPASRGPIVKIGKLKFSDGEARELSYTTREGQTVAIMRKMPLGAMLGAEEKLSPHTRANAHASLSNRRLVTMFFGTDEDGDPVNWRPFISAIRKRRKGRSYAPAQSAALLAQAIANTAVMPAVTICPPGVANGTAQFGDQFIGVVTASTGKGGAVQWVDGYTAMRDRAEWTAVVKSLDAKSSAVLEATMTAANFGQVGLAAGQSSKYATFNGGGKRAMVAANDNFAAAVKKRVAGC